MDESLSQQLWSAWAAGRLCFQKCDACGLAQQPPGPVCSHCHAIALTIADVTGDAELVAWTTVHRAPAPVFADELPYTIAVVMLVEGALIEARVQDDSTVDDWQVGARVALVLGEIAGRTMPIAVHAK